MIEVGFAELHKPVFVGGKNLTARLDTNQYKELKLFYDKKEKELVVTWNNVVGRIPSTNIACYIEGKAPDRLQHQVASPQVAGVAFTAQVETPMSHVHAGHGHGKTGVAKK